MHTIWQYIKNSDGLIWAIYSTSDSILSQCVKLPVLYFPLLRCQARSRDVHGVRLLLMAMNTTDMQWKGQHIGCMLEMAW